MDNAFHTSGPDHTCRQQLWVGVDGGDGAHTLVDDGAANGVAVVGTLQGLRGGGGANQGGGTHS